MSLDNTTVTNVLSLIIVHTQNILVGATFKPFYSASWNKTYQIWCDFDRASSL